jgi:hypothetical protein
MGDLAACSAHEGMEGKEQTSDAPCSRQGARHNKMGIQRASIHQEKPTQLLIHLETTRTMVLHER